MEREKKKKFFLVMARAASDDGGGSSIWLLLLLLPTKKVAPKMFSYLPGYVHCCMEEGLTEVPFCALELLPPKLTTLFDVMTSHANKEAVHLKKVDGNDGLCRVL